MRNDLIFEVGVEELPARFMTRALSDFKALAEEELAKVRLENVKVTAWGTPRRLALWITGLPERQPDLVDEFKGPAWSACFDAYGQPTRAAEGFAKGHGVAVEDLRPKKMGKAEYACLEVNLPGAPVAELLPEVLKSALNRLVFPKNMYWTEPSVRFARPIRWLLCLLGDQVLPLTFNGITADRITRGHRFLGGGRLTVNRAEDYVSVLFDNFVIVDPLKRREKMLSDIAALEHGFDGTVELDEDLVTENLYLTEYPVPFLGSFDPAYLDVPEEVLVTSMKVNQKYFACRSREGKLLPAFVGVSNNRPASMDAIREGNERVLKGRLDDAVFFWNEDRKEPLTRKVELLKDVTYEEKLGSLYDKTQWLQGQVKAICDALGRADLIEKAQRAALLSKTDLVTQMVGEFPELQGVMGRAYAAVGGEPGDVALALEEQYLPRYAGDRLPSGLLGAVLGLAERIYTLLGAAKMGVKVTGSQDPYGLRRCARCINELFWAPLGLDLDFKALLEQAGRTFGLSAEAVSEVLDFYRTRTMIQLKERGYGHGLAEMAMNVTWHEPAQLIPLAEALQTSSRDSWFAQLAEAATRVRNLLDKAGEVGGEVDESRFEKEAEHQLFSALNELEPTLKQALEGRDWAGAMRELSRLAGPVKGFFDDVMVMADDPAIRLNRLALLKRCDALFSRVGELGKAKV